MQAWTDAASEASRARRVGWLGLAGNLALVAAKAVAGVVGNSQALVADAIHSLTDSVTDIAIIVGVKFWMAPADEAHPHGHRRIETMITVGIGLVVISVAVGIGWRAIQGLRHEPAAAPTELALAAALASMIVKEGLYRWTARVGREIRSQALIANAWHHRSDAVSSIPVAAAVAVAVVAPGYAVVDRVAAVMVCLLILQAAWRILRPAVAELIDAGAPAADRKKIEVLALEVNGVEDAHAVRTRYVGSALEVDLHVEVDGGLSVAEGHAIAAAVRRRLLEDGPHVADVIVQIEPHVLKAPE